MHAGSNIRPSHARLQSTPACNSTTIPSHQYGVIKRSVARTITTHSHPFMAMAAIPSRGNMAAGSSLCLPGSKLRRSPPGSFTRRYSLGLKAPAGTGAGLAAGTLRLLEAFCLVGCCYMCASLIAVSRGSGQGQESPVAAPASFSAPSGTGKTRKIFIGVWREGKPRKGDPQQQHQQQVASMNIHAWPPPPTEWSGYVSLQAALLLGAVLCGRLASSLANSRYGGPPAPLNTSADAAARLARLELSLAAQEQALAVSAQRMDKANLRYRLYIAEVKKPLQQVQDGLAQQADVLTKLASAQEKAKVQVAGDEQVLGALQAVVAKQFEVTIKAIQRLQGEQASLSETVAKALASAPALHGQPQLGAEGGSRQLPSGSFHTPDDPWEQKRI